jgi:hypothetical protein
LGPAADELPDRAAASQSGAEKQQEAAAETGYQAKRRGRIMVVPPANGGGSDLPRPQIYGGEKSAKQQANAKPPAPAKLLIFFVTDERMCIERGNLEYS